MKILFQFTILFTLLMLSCGSPKGSPDEENAWKAALEENTLSAIDSFLLQYPDTKHKEEIAQKRENILYSFALTENTVFHFKNYLKAFPQGKHKKEVEEKLNGLKADQINLSDLESKTFVGAIRYLDGSKPDVEIMSMKFSDLEDSGNTVNCKVTAYVTSEIKKEMQAEIQKDKMSIKFAEQSEDEFLLEIPEGRIYLRKDEIYIESTDPGQKSYWKLK